MTEPAKRPRTAARTGRPARSAPGREASRTVEGRRKEKERNERRAKVMVLYMEGLDYRAIAAQLGVSVGTVHNDVEVCRQDALPVPEIETARRWVMTQALQIAAAHIPIARMDPGRTMPVVTRDGDIVDVPVPPAVAAQSASVVNSVFRTLWDWSGASKGFEPPTPPEQIGTIAEVDARLRELVDRALSRRD